jgi:PIN domain
MITTIFIDTNIFIHFTFFTDVDWPTVVGASEIKIVIPPIIMRELDKHKFNHKDDIIRKRAQRVLVRLAQLFRTHSEVRPRTNIHFEPHEPDEEFATLRLSRETQDDQLLASVCLYKKENPNEEILLVTDDLSLHVKAVPLSIKTLELSEDHRLPLAPNPEVRKVRDLEQKIRQLEHRMPDPQLVFDDGSNRLIFRAPAYSVGTPDVPSRMDQLKIKHPKLQEPPQRPRPPRPQKNGVDLYAVMIEASSYPEDQPSPSQIRTYNGGLESFYNKYEKYLVEQDKVDRLKARTVALKIQLHNSGTAPVERAVVFMKLPGDLELITDDHKFEKPEAPKPPDVPEPRRSLLRSLHDWSRPDFSHMSLRPTMFNPPSEPPNVQENGLEYRDGYREVSFRVRQATHGLVYNCPYDLFLVFASIEEARSFQIEWRIVAANLPQPAKGLLHIIVERDTN